MKSSSKRSGFTLVELLIVIVVIGILAAMMMLSSTEAVSSARANNIISNMRNIKTAATAWYLDNIGGNLTFNDKYEPTYKGTYNQHIQDLLDSNSAFIKDVKKYLNSENIMLNKDDSGKNFETTWHTYDEGYSICCATGNNYKQWLIVCNLKGANASTKAKLKSRASSVGLLNDGEFEADPYDGTGDFVFMPLLKLAD